MPKSHLLTWLRGGARPARAATIFALLAGVAAVAARTPYPEQPPPGHTGGFGEPTCHACHFDGPLNDPSGSLSLEGVPERYTPGERYRLTVVMTRPGVLRGGFQLAVRFAAGPEGGRQAGALAPLDARSRITGAGQPEVRYAHHTLPGTALLAPDTARWTLEWTAPAMAAGDIVFHLAANASDGDESPFGDLIYTATRTSRAPGHVTKF
jgi:hypothetical protein